MSSYNEHNFVSNGKADTVIDKNCDNVVTGNGRNSELSEIRDDDGDTEKIYPDKSKTHNLVLCSDSVYKISDKPFIIDDWSEATYGWIAAPSYPCYVATNRRRRVVDNDFNGVVRCINDDDSDHHLKLWRASVEPTTYRYVPNNAKYRISKFSEQGSDWYTVRKIKPEKIKRKEPEPKKHIRESRSKRRIEKKNEPRSRSTNSDGAIIKLDNLLAARIQSEYGQPQITKSVSDLFIENLGTKLNQLEYHVKENFKNSKQNIDESESESEKGQKKRTGYNVTNFRSSLVEETNSDASSVSSKNLRPLEKITPKQRVKVGLSYSKSVAKSSKNDTKVPILNSSTFNGGSSIMFEGLDSEQLPKLNNAEKIDSYLFGKGKNLSSPGRTTSENSQVSPNKKKGAILKYTTANTYIKSKDSMWNPGLVVDNSILDSNKNGGRDLPEVSGKHIAVTFTTQRLLRQ